MNPPRHRLFRMRTVRKKKQQRSIVKMCILKCFNTGCEMRVRLKGNNSSISSSSKVFSKESSTFDRSSQVESAFCTFCTSHRSPCM